MKPGKCCHAIRTGNRPLKGLISNGPGLLHDAKAQVTYDYRKHRIDTFLMSVQHKEDVEPEDVFHLCKGSWRMWLKAAA